MPPRRNKKPQKIKPNKNKDDENPQEDQEKANQKGNQSKQSKKDQKNEKDKNNKNHLNNDKDTPPTNDDNDNNSNKNENDDDVTDKENAENQNSLRKVEIVLDKDLYVPKCYVKFFKKNKISESEYSIIITISTRKGKNKKTSTTISWDNNNNPFPNIKLKDIEFDLKNHFNTSCQTVDDNKFVLFGSFITMKKYLVEKYGILNDRIRLNFQTNVVPKNFKISLQTKLGTYITDISWYTTIWSDESYKDFVEEFQLKLTDFKLKYQCTKTSSQLNYTIDDDCITKFTEYFTKAWHMKKDQFVISIIPRDHEDFPPPENTNHYIKNPYSQMIDKFIDSPEDSYYYQMSKTIQESYQIALHMLDNIEIKADLVFERTGSEHKQKSQKETKKKIKDDDEEEEKIIEKRKEKDDDDDEIEDFWVTRINVLDRFSIDGIQNGRFLSPGDFAVVKYRERRGEIVGRIISNRRGIITAVFNLKRGVLPPGVKASDVKYDDEKKKDDKNKKEEEEEEEDTEDYYSKQQQQQQQQANNFFDDSDDDYEYDDNENEEEEEGADKDRSKCKYTITFKPSDVAYQRSALGLLALKSMTSTPLKQIIKSKSFDPSINRIISVDDDDIQIEKQMSFEPELLATLSDTEKEKLDLLLTSSQKKCIEMVLKNHVSIVHGPPGCGKTFSIGLFVYYLLRESFGEKKRILLCAYSNQAVESIAKFVFPIVKALGKEMIWLPKRGFVFESEEEYQNASDEQKCMSVYRIMKRKETEEVFQFKELQKKKWRYEKISRIRNKHRREELLKNKDNFFSEFDQHQMDKYQNLIEANLINESDVVCCTLLASGKSNIKSFDFDCIIIDEASQADQMSSLIPIIHHPSKIILLGDHKQLDAIVPQELKQQFPETTTSLYLKLLKNRIQHVMLKTQFRMNPLICEFPNKAFYNGLIKTASNVEYKTSVNLVSIKTPIMFVDVPDGEEEKTYGLTYKNDKEAEVVGRILNNLKMNKIPGNQVGVITPYHEQLEILIEMARSMNYRGVRISCVDNFQGSERDFIILSMVRTNRSGYFGFITNKNRLNVSLTRARKGLIIVGNINRLGTRNRTIQIPENEIIIRLCEFYKKKDCVVNANSIARLTKPVDRVKFLRVQTQPIQNDHNDQNDQNDVVFVQTDDVENADITNANFDMAQACENDVDDDNDDDKFDEEYDFDDDDFNDDLKYLLQ